MELLLNYIPESQILIVIFLIFIGELLKKYTTVQNRLLPIVLPVLGGLINGFTYMTDVDLFVAADFIQNLIIGILTGWAATGGYEAFKNTFIKHDTTMKVIEVVDKTEHLIENADSVMDCDDRDNEEIEKGEN